MQQINMTDPGNAVTQFIERIRARPDRDSAFRTIDEALTRIEHLVQDMQGREAVGTRETFKQFIVALRAPLDSVRGRVKVQDNVSWVKVESLVNGHKVYIAKGKLAVGRVDSTLPYELVPGATRSPSYNGKIASWIPSDVGAVGEAIRLLGSREVPALR